jgi:hypothetical protein
MIECGGKCSHKVVIFTAVNGYKIKSENNVTWSLRTLRTLGDQLTINPDTAVAVRNSVQNEQLTSASDFIPTTPSVTSDN